MTVPCPDRPNEGTVPMAKKFPITAESIRKVLDYDPETGILTWRHRPSELFTDNRLHPAERVCRGWNTRYANKKAGNPTYQGYVKVNLGNRTVRAHIIIWLWMTGVLPSMDIDHVDLNKSNNRWTNLRLATRSQNQSNTRKRVDNISGYKGVCREPRGGKWRAQIQWKNEKHFLGLHDTKEAASAAYNEAAQRLCGSFARNE